MKLLLVIVIVTVDFYAENVSEKIHFIQLNLTAKTRQSEDSTKFDLKHL